mmetsp:Transcript_2385/g.7134  ORF Transcript_2385/g.7134 Transcript_2385/m.7134 type:complete len:103 (-) Transcript_2385:532-840(-)
MTPRYKSALRFTRFLCRFNFSGLIIHGRSDATMNPGGVRIGSCDFYHALEEAEDVADSVVVGQKWRDDERILLFVVPDTFRRRSSPSMRCRTRSTARRRKYP